MPTNKLKPVFLVGTNKIYPSLTAAAKSLKISISSVSKMVNGKISSTKGYRLGLLSERAVKVVETGQTFSSPVEAARRLNLKARNISSLLDSGVDKTTGGYHFIYDVSTTSSIQVQNTTKRANRKTNKQERIKSKQKLKQEKLQKLNEKSAIKILERKKSAEILRKKETERFERYRRNYIEERTGTLKSLLEKINKQLIEYSGRQMLDYSSAAHDVMEYIQYLNQNDDDDLFDTSFTNMEYIADNMTDENIERWIQQITAATQRNDSLFFDIARQEKERAYYAQEFGISLDQMDEYAEFLPELWLIFREGAKLFEYDSIIWDKIKQSVKGDIPKKSFRNVMDKLKYYFNNGAKDDDLKILLSDLDAYAPLPEITDDLPF